MLPIEAIVPGANAQAATMWRDLFSRKREPSPALASALADLDRLARDRPALESPARTLGRVLAAAFGTPPRLLSPFEPCAAVLDPVDREPERPRFAQSPPDFDSVDLCDRSLAIVDALQGDSPAASRLMRGKIDWRDLAMLMARGDVAGIETRGHEHNLPIDLLTPVLRLTVLPVLAECATVLAPDHQAAALCRNCGWPPSLAESRGLEGLRFLRCGVCAASWPALRLGCVSCGETSAEAVRAVFVEGEESRHRLVDCETCGFRLKVISTLSPLSAPGLLVAELATVHLDFLES